MVFKKVKKKKKKEKLSKKQAQTSLSNVVVKLTGISVFSEIFFTRSFKYSANKSKPFRLIRVTKPALLPDSAKLSSAKVSNVDCETIAVKFKF